MQDRPTAPDLLDTIAEFLMKEVLPLVQDNDAIAYKTLVSWNMLGVVSREIKGGETADNREMESLSKLMGESSTNALETVHDKRELLDKLNHRLADKIRADKKGEPGDETWTHVKSMLKDKLNTANPRFTQD